MEASILARNDERRRVGTTTLGTEKTDVVGTDEKADEEETQNVEPWGRVSFLREEFGN